MWEFPCKYSFTYIGSTECIKSYFALDSKGLIALSEVAVVVVVVVVVEVVVVVVVVLLSPALWLPTWEMLGLNFGPHTR